VIGEQRSGETGTVLELTGTASSSETPARACKRKADVMDAMNEFENGHKVKVAKYAIGKLFLLVYPQQGDVYPDIRKMAEIEL
jgi:hypothetical protein